MATMTYIAGVSGEDGVGNEDFQMKCNNHAGLFQVTFQPTTTGTVTLLGKLTAAHDWHQLAELTASGMVEIAVCPFMRLEWQLLTDTAEATILEAM